MKSLNKRHKGTSKSSQRQGIPVCPWPPCTYTQISPSAVVGGTRGEGTYGGLFLNPQHGITPLISKALQFRDEEVNDPSALATTPSFRPAEYALPSPNLLWEGNSGDWIIYPHSMAVQCLKKHHHPGFTSTFCPALWESFVLKWQLQGTKEPLQKSAFLQTWKSEICQKTASWAVRSNVALGTFFHRF